MNFLLIAQIIQMITAVSLVALVLIQTKGGGLSSSVGASTLMYRSKRGLERVVLFLTIFLGIVLVTNSLAIIFLY
jgi:protein translocase SecG subunit